MYLRSVLILILLLWVQSSNAQSQCYYEGSYYEIADDHPICVFNVSTEMYRNGIYKEAIESWKSLIDVTVTESGFENIPILATGNLGHSYYFGVGVKEDKELGINYWKISANLEHAESLFHLCKVYANPFSGYSSISLAEDNCSLAKSALIDSDLDRLSTVNKILHYLKAYRFLKDMF